jgi:hypothetical protein
MLTKIKGDEEPQQFSLTVNSVKQYTTPQCKNPIPNQCILSAPASLQHSPQQHHFHRSSSTQEMIVV